MLAGQLASVGGLQSLLHTYVNLEQLLLGEEENCHGVLCPVASLRVQAAYCGAWPRRVVQLAWPLFIPPALELHHLGDGIPLETVAAHSTREPPL